MYKLHTKCRICRSENLTTVFSFGHPMPLANDFKLPDEQREGCVPVEILWCDSCQLAQTSAVVDPKRLYSGGYSYVTSKSQTMNDHLDALWNAIKEETNAASVIEIGSNDGWALKRFRDNGAEDVLGIEPADNLAAIAQRQNNVPTWVALLGQGDALPIKRADVVIARHVFCHVDNWNAFIVELDMLCHENSMAVIEVPYLLDTMQRCELDQMYLEHTSYLSLKAMAALLKDSPFQMHKVLRFPVHGGAIAIFLRRKDAGIAPHPSVAEMIEAENITVKDWEVFSLDAHEKIGALGERVFWFRSDDFGDGKKVAAFGASAKSTVWINACGFTGKDIAFICDNTPQKQGRLSPGTDIPIVPESHLTRDNADVVINFAWNWHEEIAAKLKPWIDAGGVLLNPHTL